MRQIAFNPFVNWIVRRIRQNKNCLIMINGPTGSGKTYAAIDLALKLSQELESNFSIENNMDFNFAKLLAKTNLPQNDKAGTIFIFEEVGAVGGGASSRQWMSKVNLFFNSFMQTARCKNQIFIMTTPTYSMLEKSTRGLLHAQITMKSIDRTSKQSYAKPFLLQTNAITGKTYFKYLRCMIKGNKHKFMKICFNLPPDDTLKVYEKLKMDYVNTLNKDIMNYGKPANNSTAKPLSHLDLDAIGKVKIPNYIMKDKPSIMDELKNKINEKIGDKGEVIYKGGKLYTSL